MSFSQTITKAMNGFVLHSILGISALITSFASTANEEQSIETEEIERIQVTGSRISRTDMETSSPITIISADYIAKSGYQSVEEVLSAQPIVAGMNLGATSNNGSGGSATVNLRGMGEYRTLVLLNGRRMVSSGIGADSSVDLNTIPLALIKSIEILKDGASAVYGSDAIAGVVNIITLKDFEGSQLTIDYAETDKGDGEMYSASILHGINFDNGNLTLGFEYSGREDIIQSDRDFVSAACSYFVPGGTVDGYTSDGNGGYEYIEPCYDYTTSSYAQTPNDLYSLFTSYNSELSDNLSLSVDLLYTHRDSSQQMASEPALVYLDTDYVDYKYLEFFDYEYGYTPYWLEYARRMEEAGPRKTSQKTDTYRASFELTGYLDNGSQWDVSATYGRNDAKDKTKNAIHAINMETSIYNRQDLWFSGELLNRDILLDDDVVYTDSNKGGNEQYIITAGFNGETDSSIGYAFGAESRWESGYYTPDMVTQLGHSMHAQQDKTDGDYNVQSAYAELSLPLNDDFTLEAATRYDHYSTFGGEVTWKLGATYNATKDLMLRAVAATGFRAPNVSELYGGDYGSYLYLYDPWYDYEDAEILVTYTSGEDLQPEESDSLVLGVVWDINDNLSTTVDYWRFKTKNAIGAADIQATMLACFDQDIAACDSINITPDGDLSEMKSPLININDQEISGVDWNVEYSHTLFKASLNTTYMIDFIEDGIDYVGWIDGVYGGYAKIRSSFDIQADLTDHLSALYNVQYIHGMNGEFYGEEFTTNSVMYHNASLTYDINENWSFNLGVENLFDKEPEYVPGGDDMDTVPSIYDVIGRSFFATATVRF